MVHIQAADRINPAVLKPLGLIATSCLLILTLGCAGDGPSSAIWIRNESSEGLVLLADVPGSLETSGRAYAVSPGGIGRTHSFPVDFDESDAALLLRVSLLSAGCEEIASWEFGRGFHLVVYAGNGVTHTSDSRDADPATPLLPDSSACPTQP